MLSPDKLFIEEMPDVVSRNTFIKLGKRWGGEAHRQRCPYSEYADVDEDVDGDSELRCCRYIKTPLILLRTYYKATQPRMLIYGAIAPLFTHTPYFQDLRAV